MDDLVYRYDPGTNRLRQVDDRSIAATDAYGWDADSSWFAYNANGAMTWQSVRRDGRSDLRLQAWTDERDLPIAVTVRDPGFQVGLDYRYDAAGLRTYRRQMPLPAEQQNEHLPGGGSYRVERYLRDGAAVLGVLDGEGRLVHWNLHGRGPVGGGTFGRMEPVAQDPPDAAQLTVAAETAAGAAVDASLEHALLTAGVSERELDLIMQVLFYDPTAPLTVSEASTAVVAVVGPALLAAEALGGLVVADRAGAETHERSVLALEALLLDAMVAVGVERADKYAPDAAQVLAGEAARAVAAVVSEALDTSAQPLVRRYYVADHLGSVRAVVDTTGSVIEARDYAPWGLVMPGRVYVQGSETREGFTGHELDRETGLVYAGARYYLPALGRWTSVDPLADQFAAWSPYNYVMNSPVGLVDPDGLSPTLPAAAAAAAIDIAAQALAYYSTNGSFSGMSWGINGRSDVNVTQALISGAGAAIGVGWVTSANKLAGMAGILGNNTALRSVLIPILEDALGGAIASIAMQVIEDALFDQAPSVDVVEGAQSAGASGLAGAAIANSGGEVSQARAERNRARSRYESAQSARSGGTRQRAAASLDAAEGNHARAQRNARQRNWRAAAIGALSTALTTLSGDTNDDE